VAERNPEIAVVVPSHDRALRLRWLLNALETQTLPRDRFEVIVGHDSSGPETEELLQTHPLAQDGTLRHVTLPPGTAPPGRNRNAAWRLARAPLIAFTDDDCRPPREWLENALRSANANPGAIVQGRTVPDPVEMVTDMAWLRKTQWVPDPPTPWCEACNIVYPRELLERVDGFDETMYVGEDTDLALRARATGAEFVGDAVVETFHANDQIGLIDAMRGAQRWGGLSELVRRHPSMRDEFPMWFFWKRTHFWLLFAIAAWFLERRSRAWGVLAVPYVVHALPQGHSQRPRGRIRALLGLPHQLAVDVAEIVALIRGSIRHRKLML
jgi:glycosyltransferase involved in cell wall biosynthesis